MRLLTHNFLRSNVKGTENGYPLIIEVTSVRCEESPVDREFLLSLLPKIDYSALRSAVNQLGPHCIPPLLLPDLLPEEIPEDFSSSLLDDMTIMILHRAMFDVYLVEGYLVCPDTGRKFPVRDGIPNMILHEDEI